MYHDFANESSVFVSHRDFCEANVKGPLKRGVCHTNMFGQARGRVGLGRGQGSFDCTSRKEIFDGASEGIGPVSYTHLTLPTNREV